MRHLRGQLCDECGTALVVGMEPIEDFEEPDEPGGAREVAVDWCPNLDCPTNHALPGLLRVGMNLYVCDVCREELSGPFSAYGGHWNLHR